MGEAGKIPGKTQAGIGSGAKSGEQFRTRQVIDILAALGHDVRITLTPARKQQGQLSLVVA
jgi:hypothetical protein